MGRRFKDRVTDGTDNKTVYRMVDDTTGQTYIARARLEAVNVVEAGDQFGAAAANRLLELDTDGTPLLKVDGGTVGDKPGVIQLLRQGENDVLPGSCAYGEPVVAKDGTVYVGDESGKPVQQATKTDAVALQQALDAHKNDLKNPHKVTREQLDVPSTNDLKSHVENVGNPHRVTAKQAGALAVDGKAVDSAKLNGQAANYYATDEALGVVKKTAENALPKTGVAADSSKLGGRPASEYVLASQVNSVPTGSIQMYARTTPPSGWLLCNGQAVSRTTYAALFAVCGTAYGGGNGSTTFNLPNLVDKFARGCSSGAGGTGGSSTHNHSGNTGGTAITQAQMPSHNHGVGYEKTFIIDLHVSGPTPGASTGDLIPHNPNEWWKTGPASNELISIKNTGGGNTHNHSINNIDHTPPYLKLAYIIKT